MTHLHAVPDTPPQRLTTEQANTEFRTHWAAAREAYADLLAAAAPTAYPLFLTEGPAGRHRVELAHAHATKARHAIDRLTTELDACLNLWDRTDGSIR